MALVGRTLSRLGRMLNRVHVGLRLSVIHYWGQLLRRSVLSLHSSHGFQIDLLAYTLKSLLVLILIHVHHRFRVHDPYGSIDMTQVLCSMNL